VAKVYAVFWGEGLGLLRAICQTMESAEVARRQFVNPEAVAIVAYPRFEDIPDVIEWAARG
jgi:hypothetical protein